MLARGSKGVDVVELQKNLKTLGFDPGPIDGHFGAKTEGAVLQFQGKYGLAVDGVAGPKTQAKILELLRASRITEPKARARAFGLPMAEMADLRPEEIKYLVVHHTDSADVPAEVIDGWHKANGWAGIGYHKVIRADGSIEDGRPVTKRGSHCKGLNHYSLGVVLTGRFNRTKPTPAQINSLAQQLKYWLYKYPGAVVIPHRDGRKITPEATVTECPGQLFPWDELMKRL